jgi:ureidoacrylate peracid hydrolase
MNMLKTLEEKVDPKHAALIVVDVQNDFCHEDSPYTKRRLNLPGVQETAGRIDELIKEARQAGVQVVFIQSTGGAGYRTEVQLEQTLRNAPGADPSRDICQEGTWGAEFYKVSPEPGDWIVPKSRYSAFINTPLLSMLREKGIQSLLMTGVSTNVCVESTSRDGFMLDFYIVMVEDCCGFYKQNLHVATLENITDRFGVIASAADVTRAWAAKPVEIPATA